MEQEKIKQCLADLYQTDVEMSAWMAERIAIHGTLDYTFFHWYYEKRISIMTELLEALNV